MLDKYTPLRLGTRAVIKQTSLSGIANRYVDIELGGGTNQAIESGGKIGPESTETAVELDQLFDLFDPVARVAVQDFFEGSGKMIQGRGQELQRGIKYLNPTLSTSRRLFRELTRDEGLLARFLIDSGRLTALSERRTELTGLVRNLNGTFGALASEKGALAESIDRLPPFMRRANTTFVNLRAALDDVDPLVDASKPVARRLQPFLREARGLAEDGGPTLRDLSRTIKQPGQVQRPDRVRQQLPGAGERRARHQDDQRRPPPRRVPRDLGGDATVPAHGGDRAPVHPRLRRLVRRLLRLRRLRRARRLLARGHLLRRDPRQRRRHPAEPQRPAGPGPVQAVPRRRRGQAARPQQRADRRGAGLPRLSEADRPFAGGGE